MAVTHPDHPAPLNTGNFCNALLWNCKGDDCDYHYENATATECPVCGTPRRRCKRPPINGRDACGVHGGKSLIGMAHPSYNGIGLSKHVPTRLLDSLQESLNNPDILNGTGSIALLEARRNELLRRIDSNIPPTEGWFKLSDLLKKYRQAEIRMRSANSETQKRRYFDEGRKLLDEIEDLVIQAYYGDLTWKEINNLEETMRRLRDSEVRRAKAAEELITPDQFRALVTHIIVIGREEIHDRNDLHKFEDRLQAMIMSLK